MAATKRKPKDRRRIKRKRTPASSETSPRAIRTAERRAEALDYRRQGWTYEAIGKAMGIGPTRAFQIVDDAIKAITYENAVALRALELQRLDEMSRQFFINAVAGDAQAAQTVLAIMDRRARYIPDLHVPKEANVGLSGKGGGAMQIQVVISDADNALL